MRQRTAKCCKLCEQASNLFLCNACADDLHSLLVGSPASTLRGQPGICWYIERLTEQAYRQTRLGLPNGIAQSSQGYALLCDQRAIDLLSRITGTLDDWVGHLSHLSATLRDERGVSGVGMAEWLAERLKELRKQENSHLLYLDLLGYARESWRLINRPADTCCGPCPSLIFEKAEQPCGTLLYADERATLVRCPRCRVTHSVEVLREALRNAVRDMLFTGGELRRLMETRLNDRMPKASFYALVRDGRLTPRYVTVEGDEMFTYQDVCEARDKPVPAQSSRRTRKLTI